MITALLVNNVQRRWPVFWFEPAVVTAGAVPQGTSASGGQMSAATPMSEERVGRTGSTRSTSQEVSRSPRDLEAAVGKAEVNGVAT